jgi:hypothetical protein
VRHSSRVKSQGFIRQIYCLDLLYYIYSTVITDYLLTNFANDRLINELITPPCERSINSRRLPLKLHLNLKFEVDESYRYERDFTARLRHGDLIHLRISDLIYKDYRLVRANESSIIRRRKCSFQASRWIRGQIYILAAFSFPIYATNSRSPRSREGKVNSTSAKLH